MNISLTDLQIRMDRWARITLAVVLMISMYFVSDSTPSAMASIQIDIYAPPGSGAFGYVHVLTNGNIVVIDPYYDAPGPVTDAGAVYLYNGVTGGLISTLTGSAALDYIGSGGMVVLGNGNYLVLSPIWNNWAGAVTWGNGNSGISGVVSAANSLVGSTAGDQVGNGTVTLLSNGNYVVSSPNWDNGSSQDAGAVTWGDGSSGITGTVSAANSLVGSTAGDQVGYQANYQGGHQGVFPLSNGNYVVSSPGWDNGSAQDAGAVTWGDGTRGTIGMVSAANSLMGSTAYDRVSYGYQIYALSNGNYVVSSSFWDNGSAQDAGAVTWGDGTSGITGTISITNSLVGSTAGDRVGNDPVVPLNNGNYVVNSSVWNNGSATAAGAVTWGNGNGGTVGEVSVANSLVGSTANDWVGYGWIYPLSNGNYVVNSPYWDNGTAADAGAVTWGNGTTGITGTVSAANSLVGSTADDQVGHWGSYHLFSRYGWDVFSLSNGNYVVGSASWDNGAAVNAGAVTWGDGTNGTVGPVSAANSLVGSTAGDAVGYTGVTPLTNGNYVVQSPLWSNGSADNAGAVTWGDGTNGTVGPVSAANSLVGRTAGDLVGYDPVVPLNNGNYVMGSHWWDNGSATDAGAATWGNGAKGIVGVVSAANSLVGSKANDLVGYRHGIYPLSNGNYVVQSDSWDNGAAVDAGAVTWGDGAKGIVGVISAKNSLVGSLSYDNVGFDGVFPLNNGNYVVDSSHWRTDLIEAPGAVTWGDGARGTAGAVSAANSLVGSTVDDQVGYADGSFLYGIKTQSDGNYIVASTFWDTGSIRDAGAITLGVGGFCFVGTTVGPITASNSVRGASEYHGYAMNFDYDPVNHQLVVGRLGDNIISLFRGSCDSHNLFLPLVAKK